MGAREITLMGSGVSMIDYTRLNAALRAGGLIPGDIEAGRLVRCKVDGDRGGKKSGAYRLFDDDLPACPWWNWKAGTSGVWVFLDRPLTDAERNRQRQRIEQARRERQVEQAARWADNRARLGRLWEGAQAVTPSSAAGLYLDNRGLDIPVTDALRCLPRLDYWHDGVMIGSYPAMLGAVTSPDGDLVAIHRTYLTDDGHKAPVPAVKKLSATAGPLAGASIKIGAPAPRPDGLLGLGVAEGIETAIAVSAGVILTHPVGVNLTHLGNDGGFLATDNVDSGASSGDQGNGASRRQHSGDGQAARLLTQHGQAIPA